MSFSQCSVVGLILNRNHLVFHSIAKIARELFLELVDSIWRLNSLTFRFLLLIYFLIKFLVKNLKVNLETDLVFSDAAFASARAVGVTLHSSVFCLLSKLGSLLLITPSVNRSWAVAFYTWIFFATLLLCLSKAFRKLVQMVTLQYVKFHWIGRSI
jgi:hypothetical protein